MIIIGHRGAKGLAPENTLDSLRAGHSAGADVLEFDVRVTNNGIPILAHGTRLHGKRIRYTTLNQLAKNGSVTTLSDVLTELLGTVKLNIEIKSTKDAPSIYALLQKHVITRETWNDIIISSFHTRALEYFHAQNPAIKLALLQSINPFAFLLHQRLNLHAVGWHRLFVPKRAIRTAKQHGLFTYVYTINKKSEAQKLIRRGTEGIVTDFPNIFKS